MAAAALQYPRCYSSRGYCSRGGGCEGERAAARVGIERIEEEEGTAAAALQYLRCYSTRGYCSRGGGCEGERVAARVGGAGNAGRGALPMAGKREGISF